MRFFANWVISRKDDKDSGDARLLRALGERHSDRSRRPANVARDTDCCDDLLETTKE